MGATKDLWRWIKAQTEPYLPAPKAPPKAKPCGHYWRAQQVGGLGRQVCLRCGALKD